MHYTVNLGDLGEHTLNIEYVYSPGRPGRMYMANGDPGYPDEPPEFEVIKVAWEDGTPIVGCLQGLICEFLNESEDFYSKAGEQFVDDYEASRADYEYDNRRYT
jgi:hypothetical protein